ncbi:pif3 [Hemileuca sp. nucleopolyhedrovirus]|uniref:Pif3 n=1 Tax=Hemileuca sp. nucleopolyhedrovirus TaxID=1367203 RepID=S5N3A6_9ABAC|nr:pif3 [Hemileuca sp. nucleopolyhedrovirus]AGR56850.1 pif3 [Hemileuca sp. nucleopolyhedrovirus]
MLSTYLIGFSVILVVLIIIYYVCINQAVRLNEFHANEIADDSSSPMEFVYDRNGVVDCGHTKLPCVTDRQCIDNCVSQNAIGTLVCDEGFCSNRDSQISGRPDDFECNASLGLIKVFAASEFVVDQLCISTYRDIIDDFGTPRPYVCDDGTLNVDLMLRQFTPNDCICSPGYTKMTFYQTAFARTIPVCVPDSLASVYSRIYDRL